MVATLGIKCSTQELTCSILKAGTILNADGDSSMNINQIVTDELIVPNIANISSEVSEGGETSKPLNYKLVEVLGDGLKPGELYTYNGNLYDDPDLWNHISICKTSAEDKSIESYKNGDTFSLVYMAGKDAYTYTFDILEDAVDDDSFNAWTYNDIQIQTIQTNPPVVDYGSHFTISFTSLKVITRPASAEIVNLDIVNQLTVGDATVFSNGDGLFNNLTTERKINVGDALSFSSTPDIQFRSTTIGTYFMYINNGIIFNVAESGYYSFRRLDDDGNAVEFGRMAPRSVDGDVRLYMYGDIKANNFVGTDTAFKMSTESFSLTEATAKLASMNDYTDFLTQFPDARITADGGVYISQKHVNRLLLAAVKELDTRSESNHQLNHLEEDIQRLNAQVTLLQLGTTAPSSSSHSSLNNKITALESENHTLKSRLDALENIVSTLTQH